MREEEKLAHDVYVTLYEAWDLRVFNNIAGAEQKHTDATAYWLDYYGIEDPADGAALRRVHRREAAGSCTMNWWRRARNPWRMP